MNYMIWDMGGWILTMVVTFGLNAIWLSGGWCDSLRCV